MVCSRKYRGALAVEFPAFKSKCPSFFIGSRENQLNSVQYPLPFHYTDWFIGLRGTWIMIMPLIYKYIYIHMKGSLTPALFINQQGSEWTVFTSKDLTVATDNSRMATPWSFALRETIDQRVSCWKYLKVTLVWTQIPPGTLFKSRAFFGAAGHQLFSFHHGWDMGNPPQF